MKDWATSTSQAEPPFPFHKSPLPFERQKLNSTYSLQASDEAILALYAEERARKQRARFEESKEETKEEDDELYGGFQTSFIEARFEESKEETREKGFEQNNGFNQCPDYYEGDELYHEFKQCSDNYEEELVGPIGLGNFRIVKYEEYTPPSVNWFIQVFYNARHDLRFKLKTPHGAYMLLYADEIIGCVLVLMEVNAESAYFQIEDLRGNILFADCDQVEAHLLYIISTETKKREVTVENDIAFHNAKPKKRRKHSGPLVSGLRKLSELARQCRTSSRSS
ncbi:MAG: hypothetical protein SGBAC_002280 [Bacillariaceae sp.]